ncbi:glycoside hydrolase family 3 protein [Sediminibacterium goheungense]|uniref:Beta-glucosidase n=1 Tax=Sediminibacterium goheungense TaxID=1086393 RepID=A0A4R6IMR5_9BACT|nr:glycoside hydrolase family 3 protein [Sediminibacterium goheungense]TDO23381.1 beta-glucosidase [Sediminibacterium goheungense]
MKQSCVLSFIYMLAGWFVFSSPVSAQSIPAYKNKNIPIPERVKDLLSRMTAEEKFFQLFMIPGEINKGEEEKYKHGLFGFQVSAGSSDDNAAQQLLKYNTHENAANLAKKINAIQRYFVEQTRLGIPMIPFDEALHGLVREGATVFPQSIGLAASWNTKLMEQVADAIADEAAVRGIRQVLSPVINIATDVRWGRTEETYGEDPFLSAKMGTAFIRSFEQKNIITTPKHFIANVGDGGRDSYPVYFNERILQEIHYPPFIDAIKKGGARSIMTSYNSVDGSPATANKKILTETLKNQWGFDGFVISDASAVGGANVLHYTAKDYADAGKQAISNGLDVVFQTQIDHYKLFIPPFLDGSIPQQRIDDAVARVLTAKFQLGLFEQPYVDEQMAADNSYKTAHQLLAKKAALESIVLLKNIKNTLPLSKNIRSIALIGADATEARLGGYSGAGNEKVSILHGLQTLLPKTKVIYSEGVARKEQHYTVIPATVLSHRNGNQKINGLKGVYYSNIDLSGTPVLERTDKNVDFHWTLYGPDQQLPNDFYSVSWTGNLHAPISGHFNIGLEGNDGFRLYLDNKLIIDQWEKKSYHTRLAPVQLQKDKEYTIRVEFKETNGNAHIKLIWDRDVENKDANKIKQAINIAKGADAVIIVAGIEEGEFRDRASLQLPGLQEKLISELTKTGKKIIVVLIGGSAVNMTNWIDKVDAIIEAWYPGEQGGHAIASVLMGDYNPSGKLPITFPLSEAQLPLVYNHAPTGRGDDYNNLSGQPLFPFGFGLSYTDFQFSDLNIPKVSLKKGDSCLVSCTITNTGKSEGDEVVQLYIRDILSSVSQPVMQLKGFERIHLKAGESRKVYFNILPEHLSLFNADMNKVIESGSFRLMIGSSSRDIRLKGNLLVE